MEFINKTGWILPLVVGSVIVIMVRNMIPISLLIGCILGLIAFGAIIIGSHYDSRQTGEGSINQHILYNVLSFIGGLIFTLFFMVIGGH